MSVPTVERLAELRALYEQGLILQAYERSRDLGPLQTWEGTEARVFAGRLAAQLGSSRIARILHSRAFRDDPASPEARYYAGFEVIANRGWYDAWRFVQETPDLTEANDDVRSSWLCLRARVAALFRDFDVAERLLDQAEEVAPHSTWVWAERSGILEQEDRYDEAIAAGRRALEMRPWYRPAVQQVAHLLTLREQDAEAIELLQEALKHIEGSSIAVQLSAYLMELERFPESRVALERYAELTPLRDKGTEKWLAARRGDLAYELGEIDECLKWLKLSDNKFHKTVLERLEARVANDKSPSERNGERVLLPVGFVRQHQLTCAPATFATISRYWQRPAEHLAIAELICYDGTPRIRGREWAEQNNFVLREFRVTWDSAKALLDRRVPFALTTVDPGNAHMQAVIGYDDRRGTLLIRDPFIRLLGETLGEEMLKRQRPFGPLGMAFVPADRDDLVAHLKEMDLPDVGLHEQNHQLEAALKEHRRDEAQRIFDDMRHAAPDAPLTILARRELARYDGDTTTLLDCDNQMLAQFEDQPSFMLSKLSLLRDLARRDERLELCRRMTEKEHPYAEFWSQYGQLLADDARQHEAAQFWLRRALRANPADAGNYFILGNIRWSQGRHEEAFDLYRLASSLNERSEMLADSYFRAARFLRHTETALESLRRRFERFGKKSSQPAQTLFWAYSALERMDEAFAVLRTALDLRPDDAELKLFAAESALQGGHVEWAGELLAQAEGKAARIAWVAAAAKQAEFHGDAPRAMAYWQEVAAADPLSVGTQIRVADLMAELEGPAAGLDHFRKLTQRFPYHLGLHQEYIARLRSESPDQVEPVIKHLVDVHPFDAWSHRELALAYCDRRDFTAAFRELDVAQQCDPLHPSNLTVRGDVLLDAGRRAEARAAFREAITLRIDNDYAIERLLSSCDSTAERRAELQVVWQEMVRQVIFGDGLLEFGTQARGTFAPDEILKMLREALAARPDLWHAWSAVIVQLTEMDRLDEALELATQATERFPLLPKLWLDLAEVQQHRHDAAAEQAALRKALEINPNWALAARRLAESFERGHQLDEARELLEGMARRAPLNGAVVIELTDLMWVQGEREEVLTRLEKLLRIQPGYEFAWARLHDRTDELKQQDRFEKLVRDIAEQRPNEPRTWLIVARHLSKPEQLPERLAALDRVIAMRPLLTESYDLKAELLVGVHQYEEALAACRPAAFPDRPPFNLRGRAAWVEWHRGHPDEAIRLMQDALAEYADYLWGWRQLADWAVERENWPLAREAAEKFLALSPHDHVAWGYLGEARERSGDIDGAIKAYSNALLLSPDYAYAAQRLIALHLDRQEFAEAEKALEVLKLHVGGPIAAARSVQVALAREQDAAALDQLRELCRNELAPDWVFDAPLIELREKLGFAGAIDFLEAQFKQPPSHPVLGEWWIDTYRRAGREPSDALWQTMLSRGELGFRAALIHSEALARLFDVTRLRRFAKQHRTELRRDGRVWGQIGWALTCVEDFQAAADWFDDWRDRSDVQSWILTNFAQSLRAVGRTVEAADVSRFALTLSLDNGSRFHAINLACDACLQSNFAEARELIGSMDPHGLHSDDRFLLALLFALLDHFAPQPNEPALTLPELRARFNKAAHDFRLLGRTAPYRAAYRALIQFVAANAHDLPTKLWSMRQIFWSHGIEAYDRITWPKHAKLRAAGG